MVKMVKPSEFLKEKKIIESFQHRFLLADDKGLVITDEINELDKTFISREEVIEMIEKNEARIKSLFKDALDNYLHERNNPVTNLAMLEEYIIESINNVKSKFRGVDG